MQAQEFTEKKLPPLSATLQRLHRTLDPSREIPASEFLLELFRLHPEYAGGLAGKLAPKDVLPIETMHKSPSDWLIQAWGIFDPAKVKVLDGRLFIVGLSLTDTSVQSYLEDIGLFREVIKEVEEQNKTPLDKLLIFDRQTAPENKGEQAGTPPSPFSGEPDPTVLHTDTPALQDQLGREAFAEALATWLSRFWRNSRSKPGNSFIMHLHGAWGSGKTSLLRLLEKHLLPGKKGSRSGSEDEPAWIVVWFNAWQHQHLQPSWWSLIETIYKSARTQMLQQGDAERARAVARLDRAWRLRSGENAYLYALGFSLAVFLLLLVWTFFSPAAGDTPRLDSIANLSKPILTIISFLTSIGSGIMVLRNNLFSGSASSAQKFMHRTPDPMQNVRNHFKALIEAIDRPVMVFIDDMDRCRKEYVIRLLEEIQTLFNHSAVYYTIAADRRWLYVCFENEYEIFRESIREPGRRLGYLFLEKAFQLSVAMPQMSAAVQEAFLDYLYQGERADISQKLQEEKQAAEQEFSGISSQDELFALLMQSSGNTLQDQVRREAAVRRSAHESIEVATTFYLKKFARLLEPNPRAMKRLVNAYGIYRALAILTHPHLLYDPDVRDQFVLWTILSMRWPLLQDYLEGQPDKLFAFSSGMPDDTMPAEIQKLAESPEVQRVINGDGVCTPLSESVLRQLLDLDTGGLAPGAGPPG